MERGKYVDYNNDSSVVIDLFILAGIPYYRGDSCRHDMAVHQIADCTYPVVSGIAFVHNDHIDSDWRKAFWHRISGVGIKKHNQLIIGSLQAGFRLLFVYVNIILQFAKKTAPIAK